MTPEPNLDIAHLGHLELLTPTFDKSARFFIDVMGMTQSGEKGDSIYLRGYDDYERYSLKLTASKTNGMAHVAYRTRSPQALERRAAALKGSGFDVGWTDGDLGHGKTFVCKDPGRPRHRALLRHRMVRAAARSKAGAEEPGAALSGARLQRAPPRSLERARRRYLRLPQILRGLSRLPPDRAHRAQRRQRSRHLADRHQQVLRLRLYPRPYRRRGRFHHVTYALNSREEVLLAADIFLENGVFIETGPHKHAVQQTFFLYVYEPGGNRVEVANAGAQLILAPDWKPITWTEDERKKGQAWGLKTIELFHTHGTPEIPRARSVSA